MLVSLVGVALLGAAAHAQDPISLGAFVTRAHNVAGDVFLLSESVFEVQVSL
jgi:hypothetical protein